MYGTTRIALLASMLTCSSSFSDSLAAHIYEELEETHIATVASNTTNIAAWHEFIATIAHAQHIHEKIITQAANLGIPPNWHPWAVHALGCQIAIYTTYQDDYAARSRSSLQGLQHAQRLATYLHYLEEELF